MGEARTVGPSMKLADATDVMLDERLTRLVVVDEEEKLVGVLAEATSYGEPRGVQKGVKRCERKA